MKEERRNDREESKPVEESLKRSHVPLASKTKEPLTTPRPTHGNEDSLHPPDRPLQLVRPDLTHHQHLEIITENLQFLHHVYSAVAVVAVVGKFHSGKSFLLNQLMGKKEGFGIGPTVRPQTMGIWMWGRVSGCGHPACCLVYLLPCALSRGKWKLQMASNCR